MPTKPSYTDAISAVNERLDTLTKSVQSIVETPIHNGGFHAVEVMVARMVEGLKHLIEQAKMDRIDTNEWREKTTMKLDTLCARVDSLEEWRATGGGRMEAWKEFWKSNWWIVAVVLLMLVGIALGLDVGGIRETLGMVM